MRKTNETDSIVWALQQRFDYNYGVGLSGFDVEDGNDGHLIINNSRNGIYYDVRVKFHHGEYNCKIVKNSDFNDEDSVTLKPSIVFSFDDPQEVVDWVIQNIAPSAKTIDINESRSRRGRMSESLINERRKPKKKLSPHNRWVLGRMRFPIEAINKNGELIRIERHNGRTSVYLVEIWSGGKKEYDGREVRSNMSYTTDDFVDALEIAHLSFDDVGMWPQDEDMKESHRPLRKQTIKESRLSPRFSKLLKESSSNADYENYSYICVEVEKEDGRYEAEWKEGDILNPDDVVEIMKSAETINGTAEIDTYNKDSETYGDGCSCIVITLSTADNDEDEEKEVCKYWLMPRVDNPEVIDGIADSIEKASEN